MGTQDDEIITWANEQVKRLVAEAASNFHAADVWFAIHCVGTDLLEREQPALLAR